MGQTKPQVGVGPSFQFLRPAARMQTKTLECRYADFSKVLCLQSKVTKNLNNRFSSDGVWWCCKVVITMASHPKGTRSNKETILVLWLSNSSGQRRGHRGAIHRGRGSCRLLHHMRLGLPALTTKSQRGRTNKRETAILLYRFMGHLYGNFSLVVWPGRSHYRMFFVAEAHSIMFV